MTLPEIELSLAFEQASGVIESSCDTVETDDLAIDWFDLASAEIDLSEELSYLESRRLLERHTANPMWVRLCDESEPLPEKAGVQA